MNVAMMTMPKARARRMLRETRQQIVKKATDELRAVAEGLKWMARGRAVLDLGIAIREGGLHPDGMPKLAIARADQTRVEFRWPVRQREATFSIPQSRAGRQKLNATVRVDMGVTHEDIVWNPTGKYDSASGRWVGGNVYKERSGSAMIPMVPAKALNDAHTSSGALNKYFVLWEVEKWEILPPRDPMLLKHLGGMLYVVLAEWDLTELERAVIAGTRQ